MISFKNVTKEYNLDNQSTITPVKGVTLEVNRGDLVVIIGRSGSGKTTWLNLAAGLIKPTSGEVLIDGVNIWNMTDNEMSAFRNKKIGFVFQFPSLLPSLNSVQNVMVPSLFGAKETKVNVRDRAVKMLEKLGLGDRLGSFPRQLSAGEQKRVVIARALINNPSILLADEPTSDLDARTEDEMMELFRSIQAEGITIVMVTHSLDLIPYATKALRMENGALEDVTLECQVKGVNKTNILSSAKN